MSRRLFYIFSFFYWSAILYLASGTPISPHEAKLFYLDEGIVTLLMHQGHILLGGFIGLRIYFLLIGILSVYIYYHITVIYLEKSSDRYLALALFMLLPGIITASSLANISILVIPLVLLFVVAYHKQCYFAQILSMFVIFLIQETSSIFFVALFLYGIIKQENFISIISGIFLIAFVVLERGVAISGRPSGHFADIFGLYAAIFSPLLFLYFVYSLYRILLKEEKNILWYISFVALIGSLILSIRQKVMITDFAPYVVISVVIMLETFHKSLLIRLPEFRKSYKYGYGIVIGSLLLSSFVILFQKSLLLFVKSDNHFAIKLYKPYWLAQELQEANKKCYKPHKDITQLQMHYYGFRECKNN